VFLLPRRKNERFSVDYMVEKMLMSAFVRLGPSDKPILHSDQGRPVPNTATLSLS